MARTRAALLATLLLLPALALAPHASASAAPAFSWGADLSPWWSYDDAQRGPAVSASTAAGMTVFFADGKDGLGYASWSTTAYPTFTAFAPGDGALDRAVRDAHAAGMQVAARFDVFQDGVAGAKFPSARIGGTPAWVDPGCGAVRSYLLGMMADMVRRVPVDEVNLDHVRYPFTDEVSGSTPLPCTGGTLGKPTTDRSATIASFVGQLAATARAARPGVRVSASVFPDSIAGPDLVIGQDAVRMAASLDAVKPMLYPSYWLGSVSAPYGVIHDHVRADVAKLGAAKVQPWIQGFGPYAGNAAMVCAEVQAVRDAGGTGAAVWWFPTMGFSQPTWSAIGQCAHAAPATSTAPFAATFTKGGSNSWWVEVRVDASRPVASVSASVNGRAPVALTHEPWGSWAKSFYVAPGSRVVFRAVAADGSAVSSAPFAWP